MLDGSNLVAKKPVIRDLPLTSIEIGKRYRAKVGSLIELSRSMAEIGLLHPVVVTPKPHKLVAGERRICAAMALGWETIPARIVDLDQIARGEHDENELRKDFTPTERVAIKREIEGEIGNRQGQRTDKQPPQNLAEVGRETRELAAERAGFGNYETARQAEAVVRNGVPELIEAMDAGEIAISTAAQIAKMPDDEQRQVAAEPQTAPEAAKKAKQQSQSRPVSEAKALENAHSDWTGSIAKLAALPLDMDRFLAVLPELNADYLAEAQAVLPKLQAWIAALEDADV